jgi:probable F420-dependent oxidoreductase
VAAFGAALNTFGLESTPPARSVVGLARRAEELGFDSVWVGDHLLFHLPLHEAMAMMAAIAAATERVTVGSGVLLGVLRNPAWVAKALSTIDHLSDGRLLVGLGVGGEYPPEFEAAGVPVTERGRRTTELLQALRVAWSGSSSGFSGRHLSLPAEPLLPVPVQAHVPLWVGGRSAPALRRAATLADGWLAAFVSLPRFASGLAELRASAVAVGRDPADVVVGFHTYVRIGPSVEAAWAEAGPFVGTLYGLPPERMRGHCICGTADEVAAELRRFAAAGAEHLVVRVAGDDQASQLEQLAELSGAVRGAAPAVEYVNDR